MSKKKSDKAELKKLGARLERAEAKAERWKAEAKRLDGAARQATKEAKKLRKQLEVATAPEPSEPEVAVSAEDVAEAPATEGTVPAGAPAEAPDASWTVTRLRAAAKEKGIAGYSRRSKTELLQLLSE